MERGFKYQALGNDFLILDRRASNEDIDAARARALCDRRFGVGADGVLVLLSSESHPGRARMVVHNADGSVPEMCGNGLRCAVAFLVERAAEKPSVLEVETGAGLLRCEVTYAGDRVNEITVNMGPAHLVARNLPSAETGEPFVDRPLERYPGLRATAVSMGNPHLVMFEVPLSRLDELGPALEHAKGYAERTNVELVEKTPEGLRVAVWERGVGPTLACGTGACAVVAAAALTRRAPFEEWVRVELPGGGLLIRVASDLSAVYLRGTATFVFEAMLPS